MVDEEKFVHARQVVAPDGRSGQFQPGGADAPDCKAAPDARFARRGVDPPAPDGEQRRFVGRHESPVAVAAYGDARTLQPGILPCQLYGSLACRGGGVEQRRFVLQRHGFGHQAAQVVAAVERNAFEFQPQGARCRQDEPHEFRTVAAGGFPSDHRRDGRPDLPGVLWPRAPEERARPAVEYGQVFPQAEALSVEDMYGLV